MGIGVSLFLIAVGAVLAFAVDAEVSGIDISTVGAILMGVGAVGLLLSLILMATASRRDVVVRDTTVDGYPPVV